MLPNRPIVESSSVSRFLFLSAALVVVLLAGEVRGEDAEAEKEKDGKLYELRIYTTNPGKLPALHARFRDHTMALFEKHGMENIIYWTVAEGARGEEEIEDDLLVYVIAHEDEATRNASWEAFLSDPEWKEVAAQSEADGKILAQRPRSILMRETDFCAADEGPNRDSDVPARLFELRQYNVGPEQLPATVDRFAAGEKDLFTKHGMETVKFWTATDDSAFIYLLAHKDRDAARESWQAFFPEFREFMREYRARETSSDEGRGGQGGRGRGQRGRGFEVRYLVPTDYSPRK